MAGDTKAPIVVGVDDSEPGRLAVAWAADEAAREGHPLRLVHALDWPAYADRRESALPDSWSGRFRAQGRKALGKARDVASNRHPGLDVSAVLMDGTPKEVLREAAVEAAMVVLGSRHMSSLREALTTGGIAVPVIAHAACPVVVVRDVEPALGSGVVVVGVDGSTGSEEALAYAFETASRRGAEVLAVHVCQLPVAATAAGLAAELLEDARESTERQLAVWTAKYPGVRARREIVFGHPVQVLGDASKGALCLVVGTRGLGGFRGMLLGSVSSGLVHHARCPLIAVPVHDGE